MDLEARIPTTTAELPAVGQGADALRLRGLEATLGRRDAILGAVCFAASHFLGTADFDRDVDELLARLGTAAEVSRTYLFEGYRDARGALRRRLVHEWTASHVSPAEADAPLRDIAVEAAGLGRWRLLQAGEVLHGPVSGLPRSEQSYFENIGVRSFAAVPVFVGNSWWGYLAFTDDLTEREWSRSVLEALQAAASTLGAAMYRRRAEEALRKRESQLADAQAIAHMGSWDWDIETNELTGSDEMYRIYGFAPDMTLATGSILSRIHPDDAAMVRAAIDEAVVDGRDFSIEHRLMRESGDVRIIHSQGRVVMNAAGAVTKIIGAGHDLTDTLEAKRVVQRLDDERRARIAAESSERRAAILAEASRVLGTSFDYETTLSSLTRLAVPAVADFCTVDLMARDGSITRVGVAHVDPTKERLLWELTRYLRLGSPMVHHLRRAFMDGESTLSVEITDATITALQVDEEHGHLMRALGLRSAIAVPLFATGKVIGALALYTAESGRVFGEEDLALAQELARRGALAVENARLFQEAERATQARDQMLGVVAHDLRNPLNTILMVSQLLDELLPPDAPTRKQVAMMVRAGKQMNRLIQDLLDVKRIEHGRLTVEPRLSHLENVLAEAAEMLRPLAAARGIELELEAAADLPPIPVDSIRIQQVLSNLVGNAIKFTSAGGQVILRAVPHDNQVRITVADTGVGIAAEELPHVFGQFWQGTRTDSRGIGLGLAIAKGIVEAHGGSIWVESTIAVGTSFHFTLPTG